MPLCSSRMQQRCRRGNDAATKECADVLHRDGAARSEPGACHVDAGAARRVLDVGPARRLATLPAAPFATDWCVHRPIAPTLETCLRALFARGICALVSRAWPKATVRRAGVRGLRAAATRPSSRGPSRRVVTVRYGLDASGVGRPRLTDRAWVLIHKDDTASAGEKLAGFVRAVRIGRPVARATCAEAVPRAGDRAPAERCSRRCRRCSAGKWSDAAAFAYVGLRDRRTRVRTGHL
jgi:hypothetical protein